MILLNTIANGCQFYYDNIPVNTASTICKSTIYSFAVSFILINNSYIFYDLATKQALPLDLARPFLSAAVAGLASTIHALITPIFNCAFGNNQVTYPKELIKYLVTIGLTYHLTASYTAFKTYWSMVSIFEMFSLNCLGSFFKMMLKVQYFMNNSMINPIKSYFYGPLTPQQLHIQQINWVSHQQDIETGLDYLGLNPQNGENSVYFMPHFALSLFYR